MKQVIVLQHLADEGLGTIAEALDGWGISALTIRIFDGEKVPARIEKADGLIVLGGPVGVYEAATYPYLSDEIELIKDALKEIKPVLGICLGSQLLAAALGAKVYKSERQEIGWRPVKSYAAAARNDLLWNAVENQFTAFHWHGDVFELPAGAVSLASSSLTEHQAFRYGKNAYGILFHPEATREIIFSMTRDFADEAAQAGIAPAQILADTEKHLSTFKATADKIFNGWAKLVV
jgi:GMP synthase (glutamine-hydrolysing)